MKFCKDCEYFNDVWYSGGVCDYIIHKGIDPVTGFPLWRRPSYKYCATLREDGWFSCRVLHTCGKEARWYKERNLK